MDTRYGSWDYGKALPQEPKIPLTPNGLMTNFLYK